MPVTTPVLKFTLAIAELLLLQIPPASASVSVEVDPLHALAVPPIAAGEALTVTVVNVKQPLANV